MSRANTALELAVAELEKNSKFRLGGALSEPTAVTASNGILGHPMALRRTNRLDVGPPVIGTLVRVLLRPLEMKMGGVLSAARWRS